MTEQSKNSKIDKICTYMAYIFAAGFLIWLVVAMFGGKKNDGGEAEAEPEVSVEASESEENDKSSAQNTGSPDTDIRRSVMVDTVSKWNDIDEFSLRVDDNSDGTYSVSITANYNGINENLEGALVVYCNKVATAIDLTGHPVTELSLTWTVPIESDEPAGTCHYHSQDGVLIYDDQSNGILTNK